VATNVTLLFDKQTARVFDVGCCGLKFIRGHLVTVLIRPETALVDK